MRNLLLAVALAAPAAAEPFHYTSFQELQASPVAAPLAKARRLKTLLELFFAAPDCDDLKESVVAVFIWDDTTKDLAVQLPYLAGGQINVTENVLETFETTRDVFYDNLAAAAKLDPADPELRALAEWGKNRYYQYDPVLPGHYQRMISEPQFDALKLK